MSAYTCTSCGFENDTTRVFCQNCGARLNLAPPQATAPAVPVAQAAHPVQPARAQAGSTRRPATTSRVATPQKQAGFGAFLGFLIKKIIGTAIMAALIAAAIVMLRPPDNLPAPMLPNEPVANGVVNAMRIAMESPYPRSMDVTQDQANIYLATTLVAPPESKNPVQARFVRAFVTLGNGEGSYGVEQTVFKQSIYFMCTVIPQPKGTEPKARIVSAQIGRLRIPELLARHCSFLFTPSINGIGVPMNWLEASSSVNISPDKMRVNWPGKSGAAN